MSYEEDVAAALRRAKLTQKQIAELVGLKQPTVSQKLSGKRTWTLPEIERINRGLPPALRIVVDDRGVYLAGEGPPAPEVPVVPVVVGPVAPSIPAPGSLPAGLRPDRSGRVRATSAEGIDNRRAVILERLRAHPDTPNAELARRLGIGLSTFYRDLRWLRERGLLVDDTRGSSRMHALSHRTTTGPPVPTDGLVPSSGSQSLAALSVQAIGPAAPVSAPGIDVPLDFGTLPIGVLV